MKIKIRRAKKRDLLKIAKLNQECFSAHRENFKRALLWTKSNFRAYPRMRYFVAQDKKEIVGYILWMEKGGFRKEAVWELEQIGVKTEKRGMGIGTKLIRESLKRIKRDLKKQKRKLKLIEVTTGIKNEAQKLYRKTLGAKPECKIKDFFNGDEVTMIARNV